MSELPTYDDVLKAAAAIKGRAHRTPLLESELLNDQLGARIFFKAENMQRTGSFKFRGAYNALSNLPETAKQTGVLAISSGNHAQGVAEAARLLGFDAIIIMPSDAPQSKKDRTMRSGATVIEYDRHTQDREKIGMDMAAETGRPLVHPYENFHVIAGQGTSALEVCEDMEQMGLTPDHVLVCAGGGGLLAGYYLALKEHFPDTSIHPVEPEGFDDQARSHAVGERVGGNVNRSSLCDAILTPMPGKSSFEICKGGLAEGLQVTDDEAMAAVAFAFREMKLVVEPGGAVTLAALLAGKLDVSNKTVVCTLSGGNIDPDTMAQALAR